MTVKIELPLRAVSRNEIGTGSYWNYKAVFDEAEEYLKYYGKRFEYHFEGQVDIEIEAHYKAGLRQVMITKGKRIGQKTNVRVVVPDSCNIDDKILVDTLLRYKKTRKARFERDVWFIEDDSPTYLRTVSKRAVASDQDKIIITITSVV